MKFYCKRCDIKFDDNYGNLFDNLKCPNCKHKDIVLNFIVQGVHPPESGLGISYFEFEDVLEEGNISYLKQFFEEEFNLTFSRTGYEYSLKNNQGKNADLEKIHSKTQKDGKLQRLIYNIYYLLLQE